MMFPLSHVFSFFFFFNSWVPQVSSLAARVNAKYGERTLVYEERDEKDIDLTKRCGTDQTT